MNADNFRLLYDYHFEVNRKVWDECVMLLTDDQFIQQIDYSVGSIRNQTVHMFNIDDRWFSGLRGEELPGFLNPVDYPDRPTVREHWDKAETNMRAYLATLIDDMLPQPFADGALQIWQVLFHVLNHGTDHRAQMLAMLNEVLGVKTFPQDYAHYIFGKR